MEKIAALTDIGNSERFVSQHKDDVRYCPQYKSWLYRTGTRWLLDRVGYITRLAKQTAEAIESEILLTDDLKLREKIISHGQRSQSWSRIKAMIKLAESWPELQIDIAQLDANTMLLNCENGTVNLRTGELLPHSKENYITKSTGVEYNKDAECPLWLQFLHKIMAGNESLIHYLCLILGYCLTGLATEQCLFIFNGFGANGKSTFLAIIRKILGDYAMHTPHTTLLKMHSRIRNDLARLQGARFASLVETGSGNKLNEPLTKELTGGDPITARFLFKEYFEQIPTFKLFIATNCLPTIQGTDHGIWRRIRIIPFDVVLKDEEIDRNLAKKLEAELPGILSWAIKGCLEWQKNGLVMPDEVQSATAEYKEDSDVISKFIDDCCEQGCDKNISIKNLYDAFKNWCDENADDVLSKKTFGHFLKQRGFKQSKSNGIRSWKGIGLSSADSTEPQPEASPALH